MPDVAEVYRTAVEGLAPGDRLRLAALILNDLTRSDVSSAWTDEDLRDVTAFSLAQASARYPDEGHD